MPSNKIQYVLGIQADTSQAKKSIQELQNALNEITTANSKKLGLDIDLNNAAKAAQQLQQSIQSAVNVDTGRLNFTAFNKSLMQSNTNLNQLITQLRSTGGLGNQAVSQLARSLSTAEIPVKRMTGLLGNFATTLANSFKWQISSNIIHGMQSSLQSAVGYAQDLNETLNNIRIVTGQSVDDMAKFAANANKAAKELSTTTKAYADASLIYYQQGDSAEMAARKAATTVKAANVAFTASAKEMSEMLTAVWNSYQVGADQLESVVDVMAKLGATTASSMEEMATAMQKVASTANTVGISMEQMSAIVATSASVTRQAPQTVGTAWNTILSRIGGLKLGETLEDGVDLNKYSNALRTVGVNILDATGNLRDMGGVIDELGAKWQTLNKGQKAALAQTIGGARQYTQIMAFFENFDKYQKNIITAQNSAGALQEQQEIYAQGWEAASKRSRAALEELWNVLIDDEAIISFTNGMTKMTEGVTGLVKAFGGLPGILATISTLMTRTFSNQIVNGVSKVAASIVGFGQAFTKNGNGQPMSGGYTIGQFLTGRMPNAEERQQISNIAVVNRELERTANGIGLDQNNPYFEALKLSSGTQASAYNMQLEAMRQGKNLTSIQAAALSNVQAFGSHTQAAYDIMSMLNDNTQMSAQDLLADNSEAQHVFNLIREAALHEALEQTVNAANNAAGEEKTALIHQFDELARRAGLTGEDINTYDRSKYQQMTAVDLQKGWNKAGIAGLTENETRQLTHAARASTDQEVRGITALFNPQSSTNPANQFKAIGDAAKTAVTGLTAGIAAFNQFNAAVQAFDSGNVVQGLMSITTAGTSVAQAFVIGGPVAGAIASAGAVLGLVAGRMEIDFKKAAESAKKMSEEITSSTSDMTQKVSNVTTQSNSFNNLQQQLANGKITQEEYNDSLLNIANSLEINGASVLALSGNYKQLEDQVKSTLQAQLASNQAAAQALSTDAQNAAGSVFYNALSTYGLKTNSKATDKYFSINNLDNIDLLNARMFNHSAIFENGRSLAEIVGLNVSDNSIHIGNSFEELQDTLNKLNQAEEIINNFLNNADPFIRAQGQYLQASFDNVSSLRSAINAGLSPYYDAKRSEYTSSGQLWAQQNITTGEGYDLNKREEYTKTFLSSINLTDTSSEAYKIGKEVIETIIDSTISGLKDGGQALSSGVAGAANVKSNWEKQLKQMGWSDQQIQGFIKNTASNWSATDWNNAYGVGAYVAGAPNAVNRTEYNQATMAQSALQSWWGRGENFDLTSFVNSFIFSNDTLSTQFANLVGLNANNWESSDSSQQMQAISTFIDYLVLHQNDFIEAANNESKNNAEPIREARTAFEEYLEPFGLSLQEIATQEFKSTLDRYNSLRQQTEEEINSTDQQNLERIEALGGIDRAYAAYYQGTDLLNVGTNNPIKAVNQSSANLMQQAQFLANIDLDPSKWKNVEQVLSYLTQHNKVSSLSDWLGLSDLEKSQVQLDLVNQKIAEVKAKLAEDGKGSSNELILLEEEAEQLQSTINNIELTNFKTQMQEINDEWDNMRDNAEKALSLISNHLTNLGDLSFSDLETLRQTLLEAGLEAEHVAQILDDMRNANKGNKEDIWAGVMASTTAALMSITADQAQMKDVDEIITTGTINKIKISEGATIEPPNVDVPGDVTTITTDNASQAEGDIAKIQHAVVEKFVAAGGQQDSADIAKITQAVVETFTATGAVETEDSIVTIAEAAVAAYNASNALQVEGSSLPSLKELTVATYNAANAIQAENSELPIIAALTVAAYNASQAGQFPGSTLPEITSLLVASYNASGATQLDNSTLPEITELAVQHYNAAKATLGENTTLPEILELAVQTLNAKDAQVEVPTKQISLEASLTLAKEAGLDNKEITALEKELNILFPNGQIDRTVVLNYINGEVGALEEAKKSEIKDVEIRYSLSASAFTTMLNKYQSEDNLNWSGGEYGLDSYYAAKEMHGTNLYKQSGFKAWAGQSMLNGLDLGSQLTQELISAAYEAFSSSDPELQAIGEYLIAGLKVGLGNALNSENWTAIVAGSNLTGDMLNAFKLALGIHSPSELTRSLAPYLIQGLQVGITESIASWDPTVDGLDTKLAAAIKEKLSNIKVDENWAQKQFKLGNYESLTDARNASAVLQGQEISRQSAIDLLNGKGLTQNQKMAVLSARERVKLPNGVNSLEDLNENQLDDYWNKVQDYVNKYYANLYNSSKSTEAEIKDIWSQAAQAIFELDEQKAKDTFNVWESTFNAIAKAREALLSGGNILDSMLGDKESLSYLLRYLMNTKGMDYEQAQTFLKNPNVDLNQLQFEAYNANAQQGLFSGALSPFYNEKTGRVQVDQKYLGENGIYAYNAELENIMKRIYQSGTDEFMSMLNRMNTGSESEQAAAGLFIQALGDNLSPGEGGQLKLKEGIDLSTLIPDEVITDAAKKMGFKSAEEYQKFLFDALAQDTIASEMGPNKQWEEQAKRIDLSTEKLKEYAQEAKQLGKIHEHGKMTLAELAAALYNQNKAYDEGRGKIAKYAKELRNSKANSGDLIENTQKLRGIYQKLLDLSPQVAQKLSKGFLESAKNAQLFEEAAKGSEKAYDELAHAAALDIAKSMGIEDNIIPFSVQLDENTWQNIQGDLSGFLSNVQSWINDHQLEIEAGTVNIDTVPFFNELSQMQFATHEAAAAMNSALAAIGVDAEIVEETREVPPVTDSIVTEVSLPTWQFTPFTGFTLGAPLTDVETATQSSEGHTETYYMLKGKGFKPTTSGGGGGGKKSGGGGGGKKNDKKSITHKRVKDEGERYHEIRDRLEQQEHILERIDKIKDRAYGNRHLKALNSEIAALEKENKLQEEYYAEAAAYLASDRAELKQYGATFNSDGTVNYDEYVRKQVAWYNSHTGEYDDEEIKRFDQEYEDRMKALENYEEALDLVDSIQNDILENQNKISEILLEGIQYKLEIAVELNDKDIQKLDYYINKWSDLLNKQDESMEVAMMKMQDYESSLAAVSNAYNALQTDYAAGKLNDADYAEGLADLQDKTLEYLESINDLKKEIADYYENTLSLAEEKEQKYADKIEHTRNMMQSYIEMQQLMGRGQNFAELNSMYETSYRSSLLTAKAARDYLDTLYASRAAIIREIENSGWTETLKAQYDSVEEHIINAEDDLASKTQQTLEDAKSKFQNTIDAILKATDLAFKSLVDANGNLIMSFDEVAQDFNYWNEQQGWYVSTAKELYEVSKINRQIDDSLMDSTTTASKERLKALREEINAYAEKNRLTEYDIEMNELQYKMALAMQNLEDAQNAKSTVRLTRDENGNYGYQYTANEDDVSAARQNFEDVLQQINELSYEHQNDLVQQMIESKQNYQSELKEILDDDTLALEERNRQAETLTSQHLAQMEYIQEQGMRAQEHLLENQSYIQEYYGQTIIRNTGLVQDQIHGMMQQLMQDSGGYVDYIRTTLRQQLDQAINGYSGDIAEVGDETGLTWDTMENSVAVYDNSNIQAAENIKTLDEILGDSLANISSATAAWTAHNAELEKTISAYELLYNKMQAVQAGLADLNISDRYYNNGAIKRPNELGTTSAINALYKDKNNTNFTDNQFEASPNALGRLHNTTMSEYDISASQLWKSIDTGAMNNLLGLIDRGIRNNLQNSDAADALSQQIVNINANFDNIQSAQDIIDAFNQLTNLASQYAYTSGS